MVKSKKKVIGIVAAVIVMLFVAPPVILQMIWYYPIGCCRRCLYSNEDDFKLLVECVRESEFTGDIRLGENGNPAQIEEILERLNKRYQRDEDLPVFNFVRIDRDGDNDIYISITARSERRRGGDGMTSPDITRYDLVYIDPGYEGHSFEKSCEPFYDNWRVWFTDSWSG